MIDTHIAQWTAGLDAYALMEVCQQDCVPAGVVQDGVDLIERDLQLAAANFVLEMETDREVIGPTWADKLPIQFSRTPCDEYHRVRELGEDNHAVLADWLELPTGEISELAEKGLLQ